MKSLAIFLGVNIDDVATLREARHTRYPDPIEAVYAAENNGADGITVHLREDRRHIQERDIELIQAVLLTRLNLEMAVTDAMVAYAARIKPEHVCFVPEKRDKLTTEGGLDSMQNTAKIKDAVTHLKHLNIEVSLFIDPDMQQIEAALRMEVPVIEIHTGGYANAKTDRERKVELDRIREASAFAHEAGLIVNAGHGLYYHNVEAIAKIPQMNELNIGHGIIAIVLLVSGPAVYQMKRLMIEARQNV